MTAAQPISAKVKFKQAAVNTPILTSKDLVFAIRKDAIFAANLLIDGLSGLDTVRDGSVNVSDAVSAAYKKWGHTVLTSFSRHLDYAQYGHTESLSVMFYDAADLADRTIGNAFELAKPHTRGKVTPLLVSLDDMIVQSDGSKFPEIAFSRLFSLDGREELDYVARPGHKPVPEQIADIAERAKLMAQSSGVHTPIILLEDNVRRAKMLNWVIDLMDKGGVFENAVMAGISTSFCNAVAEERSKINHNGRHVPVQAVIDCDTKTVIEVATTRDLMFDGFVTQHEGMIGRLPGIFMDVEKRFKIAPGHAKDFRQEIVRANIAFCNDIETSFGVKPPLAWFDGGPIIARIMGCSLETPMVDIMKRAQHGLEHVCPANDDNKGSALVACAKAGVPCFPPLP